MLSNINTSQAFRTISWLLMPAVFCMCILPAHYHLHHMFSDSALEHDHVIDLHLMTQQSSEHPDHSEAQIFNTMPDGLAKKFDDNLMPLLFLCLSLLLALLRRISQKLSISIKHTTFYTLRYLLSPPLRAPPSS